MRGVAGWLELTLGAADEAGIGVGAEGVSVPSPAAAYRSRTAGLRKVLSVGTAGGAMGAGRLGPGVRPEAISEDR